MAEKILPGTKLFARHNADNSTKGRPNVGSVLSTVTKDLNGKLRAISVACMSREDAEVNDVCSVEAQVIEVDGMVSDIEAVSGIAVSNSKIDQPAFKSAKRMAMVQAFEKPQEEVHKNRSGEDDMDVTLKDLMGVPITLIKQAVAERQMHPNQLFEVGDLEKDREFGPLLEKGKKAETELADTKTKLDAKTKENTEAVRKSQEEGAQKLFKDLLPEGTTEQQEKFLSKMFNPSELKEINKESITKFIEDGKKEYAEYAGIFGKEDTSDGTSIKTEEGEATLEEAFGKL